MMNYLRDPGQIYARSFETVRREASLERFDTETAELVVRLIHSCGMLDIAEDLVISADCLPAGRKALADGKPIICDSEMVARGVIRRGRAAQSPVICMLNDSGVADRAKAAKTTRSAAAVELWPDHLLDAVVAIGNAPTALFRLLEGLDQGWPKPAAILAFPVGFVGAAESKAALVENPRGVAFATLHGRRGGSAMAAAAVNALALGLNGDGL